MSGELEQRLAAYLAHRLPAAEGVVVRDLARIHGGASQETFRFHARWAERGAVSEQEMILRRAPETSLVTIDHDLEYAVYTVLAGSGLPVPRAHWLESDPRWLDRPFFIMDMMPGKPGQIYGATSPYDGAEGPVARNFWRHLGQLAAIDPAANPGWARLRNSALAGGYAAHELDYWEAGLDANEAVIEPIVRGAIRWLRANPPPDPARPSICHGDYRSGNFLFLPDGAISAILDWEMCHLGDPLEDVAWALDPMWTIEPCLPLGEAVAIWEEASGLALDRDALEWWRLFSAVKACALWTAAEAGFQEGTSREIVIALTAMRANHFHRKVILEHMRKRGAMG